MTRVFGHGKIEMRQTWLILMRDGRSSSYQYNAAREQVKNGGDECMPKRASAA